MISDAKITGEVVSVGNLAGEVASVGNIVPYSQRCETSEKYVVCNGIKFIYSYSLSLSEPHAFEPRIWKVDMLQY
jgi:hypothetical protein